MDSVVITDFGYSYSPGVNGTSGQHDLPGTLPYMAPEILGARIARKSCTKHFLEELISKEHTPKDRLKDLQKRHALSKDTHRRLTDTEALEAMEHLCPAEFKAIEADEMRAFRKLQSQINWQKLDIYSAAIVLWKVFHNLEHPFPGLVHVTTDRGWHTALVTSNERPTVSIDGPDNGGVPKCLCTAFESVIEGMTFAWASQPGERPTARQLQDVYLEPESFMDTGDELWDTGDEL